MYLEKHLRARTQPPPMASKVIRTRDLLMDWAWPSSGLNPDPDHTLTPDLTMGWAFRPHAKPRSCSFFSFRFRAKPLEQAGLLRASTVST